MGFTGHVHTDDQPVLNEDFSVNRPFRSQHYSLEEYSSALSGLGEFDLSTHHTGPDILIHIRFRLWSHIRFSVGIGLVIPLVGENEGFVVGAGLRGTTLAAGATRKTY